MFRRPSKDSAQSDSFTPPAFSNNGKIQTVIGPGATFNGTILTEGGARIDGSFDGNLTVKGPLVIGEGARVVADISAESVSVAGSVKGNITAKRVDIMRTGRIYGDLTTGSFTTEEGGFLRGQVRMTDGAGPEEEVPIFNVRPLAAAS